MSGAKNKTRLSSRGVAATFLICCVLFSLLVLGGGKLSALRSDVLSAYDGGEGSIISDLTKHNENAYNIITVGKRVLGADDSAITDAEAAYKAMNARRQVRRRPAARLGDNVSGQRYERRRHERQGQDAGHRSEGRYGFARHDNIAQRL